MVMNTNHIYFIEQMNYYKSTPDLHTSKGEKKRKKAISSFNSTIVMFVMLMMLCQHGDGPSIV
jgi:hypothetical protein